MGIRIAPEIASELANIAHELERLHVRPVMSADMHVTLVPPWQAATTEPAVEKLHRAVADCYPFPMDVTHVGYGPTRRRPRLLWAACVGGSPLEHLRRSLLAHFDGDDDRRYRPHITLARLKGDGHLVARAHPIDRPLRYGQRVESVQLFQSPAAGERGYRVLTSARLELPPVSSASG